MTETAPATEQNNGQKKPGGKLRAAFMAFALASIGAVVYINAPHSDRKNAEKQLKENGYTIVSYEGATWGKGKTKYDYYTDEFKVVPPGKTDTIDVVVATGAANGTQIKLFP